jgi:hypothetical protein
MAGESKMQDDPHKKVKVIATSIVVALAGLVHQLVIWHQHQHLWQIGVFAVAIFYLFGGLLTAAVLYLWHNTKAIAQGIMIGVGIVLLIGLSICSFKL